jgi:hypothetical protein
MQEEGVTWNESHLRKADLLTRTRAIEDASRWAENQYYSVAEANPEAKSAISAEATGHSRSYGEGDESEGQHGPAIQPDSSAFRKSFSQAKGWERSRSTNNFWEQ